MHLFRDGRFVDAEFSLDFWEREPCIVVESSGGATKLGRKRRNPEYNRLVALLLERLAGLPVRITRVVLDSAKVSSTPSNDRIVQLRVPYPILVTNSEVDDLRRAIGRQLARMFQDPGVQSGGNGQKRFRICLERVVSAEELQTIPGETAPQSEDDTSLPSLDETERVQLRTARIGQGAFRDALVRKYAGRCPLTGIESLELLVASHIKPWAHSSNQERLDANNGLLLSALADRLFDRGLMMITDDGEPIFSSRLSFEDREFLSKHIVGRIVPSECSRHYLDYHRNLHSRP